MSALTLDAVCENCGKMILLQADNDTISFRKRFEVNGESIYLTYYDCPDCGRRHVVQVDDLDSLVRLEEVGHLFRKNAIDCKHGRKIPKKREGKFRKAQISLRECRERLMKKFNGVKIHDEENDQDFELRFKV